MSAVPKPSPALDPAQALGDGEDLQALHDLFGPRQVAVDHDRDHAAEAAHLAPGQLMLRMALQPRIIDLGHTGPTFEPARDRQGVLRMPRLPQRQTR
mgnify:CR=1 FL=1